MRSSYGTAPLSKTASITSKGPTAAAKLKPGATGRNHLISALKMPYSACEHGVCMSSPPCKNARNAVATHTKSWYAPSVWYLHVHTFSYLV
jgi:hypothetical protein